MLKAATKSVERYRHIRPPLIVAEPLMPVRAVYKLIAVAGEHRN
jgi:hypothetical protein